MPFGGPPQVSTKASGKRTSSSRNDRIALKPKTLPASDVRTLTTDPSSNRSSGYATYAKNASGSPGTSSIRYARPL
jgi:hypothetical protein